MPAPSQDEALQREIRPLGPERQHYWYVQRMAQASGVDLIGAMQDNRMTQTDWAEIITRCRGCRWTEGCSHWLAKPSAAPRDLPEGCANRARLAALKNTSEESLE